MRKRITTLVILMFFTLSLVSCGSKSVANDSDYNGKYDYLEAESGVYDYVGNSYSDDEKVTNTSSVQNDLRERKIIKNASINFETKSYDKFLSELYSCINSNGGYVQSQDSRGSGVYDSSSRYSNLTIRIPEGAYDSFMNSVGTLGSMVYLNEYQNDVTMNYIDIESHIGALKAEYDALIAILETSTVVEDIITLQSRISDINYQLDSYKSQLRKYDDLISYCTINISVSEVWRETPNVKEMTFGEQITTGLERTIADISKDFSDFTVWFVVSLPYIIIWAAIVTIIVLTVRFAVIKIKRNTEIKKIDRLCEKYGNENKKTEK